MIQFKNLLLELNTEFIKQVLNVNVPYYCNLANEEKY